MFRRSTASAGPDKRNHPDDCCPASGDTLPALDVEDRRSLFRLRDPSLKRAAVREVGTAESMFPLREHSPLKSDTAAGRTAPEIARCPVVNKARSESRRSVFQKFPAG